MKIQYLAMLTLTATPLAAQGAAEKEAVLKTVNQLFDGMRKHDSAMVHAGAVRHRRGPRCRDSTVERADL